MILKASGPQRHETSQRDTRWAALGGLLLLSLWLNGCKPAASAPPPPAAVSVSLPLKREVSDWDEYTGHLSATDSANIAAQVSGIIQSAPFKEGALVNAGDVLFTIDDRPFKADLDAKKANVAKDEAQVALTQAQLTRSEDLLKKKTISQQDYDTSKAGFDGAKAQLAADQAAVELSQTYFDWTRVRAPISGRVSRIYVTAGNLVNGGAGQATLLTTIVSVDPIYCMVALPERAYLRYQAYAERVKGGVREEKIPCFVKLENETGFPHEGVIDFLDNNLDTNTGTIQLRGLIPNPNGALTPGLFAQMRVSASGPYKTLLVPDVAVGTEQNERYLLVVGKDDVVVSRRVKLGELFGSLRSIVSGLQPDDRVIVNGLQQVRAGAKVTVQEVPIPPEAIAALEASSSGLALARKGPDSTAPATEAKP